MSARQHLDLLLEDASGPRLFPGLDPAQFKMTALADARNWRAVSLHGAHLRDRVVKKGAWDSIGYIMVDPENGFIVPTANSDSHRSGYEVLYDRQKKLPDLNPRNFLPVWPYGICHMDKSQRERWIVLCKVWLAWGGKDLWLEDYQTSTTVRMSQAAKGQWSRRKGATLTADGKNLVALFQGASQMSKLKLTQNFSRAATAQALRNVEKLLAFLDEHWRLVSGEAVEKAKQAFAQAKADPTELGGLEDAVFGFSGVKRSLHNKLRKMEIEQNDPAVPSYMKRDYATLDSMLGSVPTLIGKLDSI